LFFSRENFSFSAYFLLQLSNRYEHAKIQLLLIKFNTRNLAKQYTLTSSDVDFETFEVLGTTLLKFAT